MLHQKNATELNYDKAFPFDVIRYREVDHHTDKQIRYIVDTVWNTLPFDSLAKKSSRKKYRAMVKNYVLNLIKSYRSGYFVRVPRNRNDLHYEERYSHIYTTPSIVIKTMDALDDNDWIDLHIGYYDQHRQEGKQTRIFPSQKFIDLVDGTVGLRGAKRIFFTKEAPKESIQLRHKVNDKKYRLVPYNDTPKTILMRKRLKIYNDFMSGVLLTILPLTRKELKEMDSGHRDTLNNMLLNGSMVFCDRKMRKGSKVKKEVKESDIDEKSGNYKVLERHNRKSSAKETLCTPLENEEPINTTYQSIPLEQSSSSSISFLNTITNNRSTSIENQKRGKEKEKTRREDKPITKTLTPINEQYQKHNLNISLSNTYRENEYYSIEQVLNDYPKSRKFWFRIIHSDMLRAFSDTSKTFNHHGRFYGDPVQNLPKWMRAKITMGLKDVVECDFTSIHPTMLYVMAGAVPPENIYMIDKSSDPQLRDEYKTVLLVSINHKAPKTMWNAVSKHFRENLGYQAEDERLTKQYIEGIYDRMLEHNKPIAHYMNTGVAMRLMRKDSEIADRIMYEFVTNEIPIRCVHDSFIVPAEYEQELRTLMVEYFQEVMATDYEIGITTETSVGNSSKKALNSPVLNVEKKTEEVVIDENFTCRDDSRDDSKSNALEDNMKYFDGLNLDDFYVDLDIDWNEFSRRHSRYSGDRFQGIRF